MLTRKRKKMRGEKSDGGRRRKGKKVRAKSRGSEGESEEKEERWRRKIKAKEMKEKVGGNKGNVAEARSSVSFAGPI